MMKKMRIIIIKMKIIKKMMRDLNRFKIVREEIESIKGEGKI
jgi:hypothetical protein